MTTELSVMREPTLELEFYGMYFKSMMDYLSQAEVDSSKGNAQTSIEYLDRALTNRGSFRKWLSLRKEGQRDLTHYELLLNCMDEQIFEGMRKITEAFPK